MKATSARLSRSCVLGAALVLALAGAAAAEEVKKKHPRDNDASGRATAAAAPVATAPNARMAALIKAGGRIIRQKNVASVTNPDIGIYCITPTAGLGIAPGSSIVIVSPEFFYSRINEVKVQWAAAGSPCGSGKFAVYTLADFNLDAAYGFSNDVGFSIVVP